MPQLLTQMWEGADFPFTVSPEEIDDRLHHRYPYRISQWEPRFQLLQFDSARRLQPVPLGLPSLANDPADFSTMVAPGGSITVDTTRPVIRTADITIRWEGKTIYNAQTMFIRIFWSYIDSGKVLFEFPIGTFYALMPERSMSDARVDERVPLGDLSAPLGRISFVNTYKVAQGYAYTTAMTDLLQVQKLSIATGGTGQTPAGKQLFGPQIPLAMINVTTTSPGETLPDVMNFTEQDTFDKALADLADACNYLEPYPDEMGIFQIQPMQNLSDSIPASAFSFDTSEDGPIIEPPVSWKIGNLSDLYNVYKCGMVNSTTKKNYQAIAANVSPNSLISLVNLPFPIVAPPDMSTDIPSQAAATNRAGIMLQLGAAAAEVVTFTSRPVPLIQPYDRVDLILRDANGVPMLTSPNGWQVIGMQCDFSTMRQTFTVQRNVPL